MAVYLPNSVEFVLLYFACAYSGLTVVPISLNLSHRERQFIISHSGVKALIHAVSLQADIHDILPSLVRIVVGGGSKENAFLDFEQIVGEAEHYSEIKESNVLSIHFTSGTTGEPKAVAHTVGSLFGNALCFNESVGIDSIYRFLHIMPMAYMAGFLNTILCPFMAGASVVLAPQFDARTALNFWAPVVEHAVNALWMSPTMLISLLQLDRSTKGIEYCSNAQAIKQIFAGTAPLPQIVRREFYEKYGVDICESYGLSELLLLSANISGKPLSVGKVLPSIGIEIRDEHNKPLSVNKEGEIAIQTPYASVGYIDYETGLPQLPSPSSWFLTGDIGYVDEDGDIFVTARKKDIIIRGGFNISPRAVEEAILKHQDVDNVAVIGLPHEFYGEEVVACVQMKSGCNLTSVKAELIAYCRSGVNVMAVPTTFIEVETLPVSVTGKVLKAKVRETILRDKTR